ncbi:hypothetical protein E2C01_097890 [Portunus trituberculatus]|uniref:Fibronectin type-III domain-containing protein n=1 Tax=Portunus trituberculatus TaxID=210409 RepID=A0A5B7K1J1_PORTR|nr:hypothetical protein [Portunus trituberculatus]
MKCELKVRPLVPQQLRGAGQSGAKVVEANGDFKPVVEVTREAASFSVANLRPATAYRLLITATNAKGESRPAELSAYTVALNHPQHETPAGEPLMTHK